MSRELDPTELRDRSASATHCVVERTGSARIPTRHGSFVAHAYRSKPDAIEHIAYVTDGLDPAAAPLVRAHSECLTGDIFGSLRCDCGSQLDLAMRRIAEADNGVVIYVRGHEGRGIGLGHKLEAYALQDQGLDTVDANEALGFASDLRTYDVAAAILESLGVSRLRLLTNNPTKVHSLESHGFTVEQVALVGETTEQNARYLQTKRDRMGHHLDFEAGGLPA